MVDKSEIVQKIELAQNNLGVAYDNCRLDYAVKLHKFLSEKKILFFFPRHRELPSPTIDNLEALLLIAKMKHPQIFNDLTKIGLKFQTLLRIAQKADKIPQLIFVVPKNEMDLINDWAENKGLDKLNVSQ